LPSVRSRRHAAEILLVDSWGRRAVNVRAPYFLVQQLLPVFGEGSSVILVSSLGAHAAVGTLSAYAATKGAIDTLVKYFAAALGPRGASALTRSRRA
jgi:3-oxoacyl-[acyl-carrier protein] reductase